MQQRRHQRNALFGTNGRHHISMNRLQINIAGHRKPFSNRSTQIGSTCSNRISIRIRIIRRHCERLAHRIGHGIDGRPHGQVDHASERGFCRALVCCDTRPIVWRRKLMKAHRENSLITLYKQNMRPLPTGKGRVQMPITDFAAAEQLPAPDPCRSGRLRKRRPYRRLQRRS